MERRNNVLFVGLGSGITNIRKIVEWENVASAVYAVSSANGTTTEIKKKWWMQRKLEC